MYLRLVFQRAYNNSKNNHSNHHQENYNNNQKKYNNYQKNYNNIYNFNLRCLKEHLHRKMNLPPYPWSYI